MRGLMQAKPLSVLGWMAAMALIGLGALAFFAWRSVTVEEAAPDEALHHFVEIRARLKWTEPILRVDEDGVASRRSPRLEPDAPPVALHALAYRTREQRLVRVDVPFWFLKMKGPAAEYSLRGTGLDLQKLGITPRELEQYGPCVVLDETRANGDRLLVWTD